MDDSTFSRISRTGEPLAELRVNCPVRSLNVLDAVAISETKHLGKFVSRTDIVNNLINDFVEQKVNEATLIINCVNENPTVMENS